ncbi:hypothetical protein BT93_L5754 [Corymbia citriodora subsp. variegata]|uniref:Uncharacterized protein n=1 Tax=Corymbia citriodora subsp. variegata TaxID=360336 RepID=A0A8T0CJJ2_CORYI|nr:hypothetical protein BT93_L5754 [Corymbia citriodora subsp. variegata]
MPQTKDSSLPWNYIAKLVCIGDSSCGKSSLTTRLCEGRFSASHDVTIGVEFGSVVVKVGHDSKMKLSLWDTAGQETYKSVTRSYFRGASGALLVFDITKRKTFEHVVDWLSDLRQIADEGIVVILVGNKLDLADHTTNIDGENKRAVTQAEAEEWCKKEGVMKYIETSAKSGQNVELAFQELAEKIYQNIEAGKYDLNDKRSGVKPYGQSARDTRTVQPVDVTTTTSGKSGCC